MTRNAFHATNQVIDPNIYEFGTHTKPSKGLKRRSKRAMFGTRSQQQNRFYVNYTNNPHTTVVNPFATAQFPPTQPTQPTQQPTNKQLEHRQRSQIYQQTKQILETKEERLRELANLNMARWERMSTESNNDKVLTSESKLGMNVYLVSMDTLDCAQRLTMLYGKTFAVLNMANAFRVGGGYLGGSGAQEENIFRRTSVSFEIEDYHTNSNDPRHYAEEMTDLINADDVNELVYMNTNWSVCFRTSERFATGNIKGYDFMASSEVFPFYELRSAALNKNALMFEIQKNVVYSKKQWWSSFVSVHMDEQKIKVDTVRRIRAQLNTCVTFGVRHVVLSAFGCGAFGQDPSMVAEVYRELLINEFYDSFDVIAFAIYYAGFGEDNYKVFVHQFNDFVSRMDALNEQDKPESAVDLHLYYSLDHSETPSLTPPTVHVEDIDDQSDFEVMESSEVPK